MLPTHLRVRVKIRRHLMYLRPAWNHVYEHSNFDNRLAIFALAPSQDLARRIICVGLHKNCLTILSVYAFILEFLSSLVFLLVSTRSFILLPKRRLKLSRECSRKYLLDSRYRRIRNIAWVWALSRNRQRFFRQWLWGEWCWCGTVYLVA